MFNFIFLFQLALILSKQLHKLVYGLILVLMLLTARQTWCSQNKIKESMKGGIKENIEENGSIWKKVKHWPTLEEDGDIQSLQNALKSSLLYYSQILQNDELSQNQESLQIHNDQISYSNQKKQDLVKKQTTKKNALSIHTIRFSSEQIPVKYFYQSFTKFDQFLNKNPSVKEIQDFLKENFDLYHFNFIKKSTSKENITQKIINGNVIFSSYYEPTISARLSPSKEFSYPLYARPKDLIDVRMEKFDDKKKGERIVGRAMNGELHPYFSRKQIDSDKILENQNLEIAWTKDPVDILTLQIQGSGWLEIDETQKSLRHIRYAGDNGLPYHSVGLFLIESGRIVKAEFSKKKMLDYLKSVSSQERQEILNSNPRYVFFQIDSATVSTVGSLKVPLTPGRSIASDPKIFPAGGLAWITTTQPVFKSNDRFEKREKSATLQRFVFSQDEGGAIQGNHRIDYFVGRGAEAERFAENLWDRGDIYIFIPKLK